MFLLSCFGRSNLGLMTYQTFDSEFFYEVQKPLHRSSGLDSHTSGSRKAGTELSHVVASVLQSPLHHLARAGVQHDEIMPTYRKMPEG